jgi:DNA polymerase-3 subunit epsilon
MRQLILDTETTGFDPKDGHKIIEFAALEMVDRKLTGNYLHLYINPLRDIPREATKVHGITNDKLEGKPSFELIANKIIDFISDSELIIHNAKFDLSFLDYEFKLCNYQNTNSYVKNVIDTLQIARNKYPGAKNSLDALCDRFKINRTNRDYHGALIDCNLLADVYIYLTREQYNLLEDNKNNEVYSELVINPQLYNLKSVVVKDSDLKLHANILQDINRVSNGKCMWSLDNELQIEEK